MYLEKTELERECLKNSITKFKLMFASIEMAKNQSSCKNTRIISDQDNVDKITIRQSNEKNVDIMTSHKNVVNDESESEYDEQTKTSSKPSKNDNQTTTIKGKCKPHPDCITSL